MCRGFASWAILELKQFMGILCNPGIILQVVLSCVAWSAAACSSVEERDVSFAEAWFLSCSVFVVNHS